MPRGVYSRNGIAQAEAPTPEQTPGAVLDQPASPRADEMRRARRRRDDGDLDRSVSLKLTVPHDIQDKARREGKVIRWINDGRFAAAYQDDWEKVEGVDPIQANPILGTEERLVLCEKFADWDAKDRARDDMYVDALEQRTMAGQINDEDGSSAGLHIPRGQTNRVTTQRGL